jgi:hypothetical protein
MRIQRSPRPAAPAAAVFARFAASLGSLIAFSIALALAPLSAQTDEESLFNLLIPSFLPILSPPAAAATPAPLPSPIPMNLCPVCGTSFPGVAKQHSAVWGIRLDLRTFGKAVRDPPDLPMCPNCRFVIFKTSFTDTELARLRAYVASDPYKKIEARHFSYYYLAKILEAKAVPLKDGSYSIAHAYLQAAWQAEDYKDAGLVALYLQNALTWADAFAKESKPGDYYYPTSRLLPGELLRRLGRFAEAAARFAPLEKDQNFSAAYLQRIIAAEQALIRVQDSSPQASP